jgi:hypothetical protein
MQNFFDEYGSLPILNATMQPISSNSAEGLNVMRVLLAQETAGPNMLNTKAIRFLDVRAAKARKGGIEFAQGSSVPIGLYDAWGNPFYFAFDHDYNDEINNPIQLNNTDPLIIRGMKGVVYSWGADGQPQTRDDVRTW